jgi:hypothetical protein
VTIVLDTGSLIAVEHGDRDLMAIIKREWLAGRTPLTHGGVVGQAWRGGSGRQASLARLLPGVAVEPLDDELGRRAGVLLGATRTKDVIDAAVVLIAHDGDELFTSDPDDLVALAQTAGLHVDLIPI